MKRALLILILIPACLCCLAQEQSFIDVIIYKNGSTLKGTIVENVPGDYLMLKTIGGDHKVVKYDEIEKIEKESLNLGRDTYGGNFSSGFAIGGGGLVGIPICFWLNDLAKFEGGIHLRPVVRVVDGAYDDPSINVLFSGAFDFYFKRVLKEQKKRVQMNGIFMKGGYHTGKLYKGSLIAAGWAYERFKLHKKNKSVSFELGLGLDFLTDKILQSENRDYGSDYDDKSINPMIYWKVGWNFF